jgi:hypothetical protein
VLVEGAENNNISPIVCQDLTARTALEKLNSPDVKDHPSGPERIRVHHRTFEIPDEELATLEIGEEMGPGSGVGIGE